ncbi:MAG: TPM domain-containing protein [Ignavibacteria bacterium]|nr:TPM domain-containing protein [Ignavibacteria bacterium]
MGKNFIHKILSKEELDKISDKIKEAEKLTSGEIRVSIKNKRGLFNKSKSIRDLAVKEFFRLRINKTKQKNGILLFLLLSERQFYILPDEGISLYIEQTVWDSLAEETERYFKENQFCSGIVNVIEKCGKMLSQYFPIQIDDKNELSNKVEVS